MEKSKINIKQLGVKAQSKSELYKLLTVEAHFYLPPQRETTVEFVRDIIFGNKKAIYDYDVKVCAVPHVDSLRLRDFVQFMINQCEDGLSYLPKDHIKRPLNRQWVCNICNTLNYEGFQSMITEALRRRQEKFFDKNNLEIEINQDLAEIIQNSAMISTTKGRSHFLLKPPMMDDFDDFGENLNFPEDLKFSPESKYFKSMKSKIDTLESKLKDKEAELQKQSEYAEMLGNLYDKGVIDDTGRVVQSQ